jgi:hypothetical protein
MAKRPDVAADDTQASARERIARILHQARVRGGWDDEEVADRILQELGGADRSSGGDVGQAAPDVPTVFQASSLQTPIQPPNPALGPPPDDMIKGVEPPPPQPEPGKHPAPAPDEQQQAAADQPAAGGDEDEDEGADRSDARERRASSLGRRHPERDHDHRDRDHDRGRDHGKK